MALLASRCRTLLAEQLRGRIISTFTSTRLGNPQSYPPATPHDVFSVTTFEGFQAPGMHLNSGRLIKVYNLLGRYQAASP